jgi:glycosyltransferase involved in cell wall biosynthesis
MFLQAAKRLLENGVDAEFHITGKGELEDFARSFAKKNSRNVQFHGYLPDDELNDLIANCHLTVHPSLWPDPCPLSVIKSVKLGTAAVASDRGGLPELLPRKYIFKPDKDQLQAKLLEFIKNPDDFPPLASIDMNPESAIAKLIEIYRQVVEGVQ